MSIIKDRRIGRFQVSIDLINGITPEGRKALFGSVIVLKAEMLLHADMIEYTAICDSFAPVGDGKLIKLYTPWMKCGADGSVEIEEWR